MKSKRKTRKMPQSGAAFREFPATRSVSVNYKLCTGLEVMSACKRFIPGDKIELTIRKPNAASSWYTKNFLGMSPLFPSPMFNDFVVIKAHVEGEHIGFIYCSSEMGEIVVDGEGCFWKKVGTFYKYLEIYDIKKR